MLKQNRKEALRLVATMLGRRFGVQVVFGNIKTAATTGKVIYLPNLATTGSEEDMILLYGLVAHEAAHCRFTEFKDSSKGNVLVRALDNVFEDMRIELALARIFPGAARMLFDAANGLAARGILDAPQQDEEYQPADILCRALVMGLRSRHLKQHCLDEMAGQWRTLAEDVFGDELIEAVFELADRSATLTSTDEASALAWEVYELLETSAEEKEKQEEQQKQKQQSKSSQDEEDESHVPSQAGQDEDEGDSSPSSGAGDEEEQDSSSSGSGEEDENGEDSSPGSSDDRGEDDSSNSDESQGDQGDSEAGDSDERGEADAGDFSSQGEEGDSGEQAAAMRQALKAQSVSSVSMEDMLRQQMGANQVMGAGARTQHASRTNGVKDQGQVRAYLKRHELKAKLGTRLASLIESTVEESLWDGYTGRKLSHSAPERLSRGDLKIFLKKEETAGTNTAVALLVDYSGSMWTTMPLTEGGSRAAGGQTTAQEAAYETHFALASVLSTYEVPFLSIAFANHVCVLKEFDEPLSAHRWDDGSSGDTATGDAVEEALIRMTEREEEKRILVVVTDGEPNDHDSMMAGCRFARQNGIQIAVVFIGSMGHALEAMLNEEEVAFDRAMSADRLSQAVFGAVAKAVA